MADEQAANAATEGSLARFGLALAQWSERWFPDPLVFAMIGIVFVFVTGISLGERPSTLLLRRHSFCGRAW